MNVLHAPFNIGSQASSLADAENAVRQEAGYPLGARGRSWSVDFEPGSRYSVATEVYAPPDGWAGTLHRALRPLLYGLRHAAKFRVLHLYSGRSLLRCEGRFAPLDRRDLPLWKALGKTIFVTFQGCEARFRQGTVPIFVAGGHKNGTIPFGRRQPSSERPFSPCRPGICDVAACDAAFEARARRWADTLMRWADKTFCVNPDLIAHVPGAEFLPYVALPAAIPEPRPKARRALPVIVHAPSNRSIKGTEFLLAASEALRATHPHELRLIEGLPREQALAAYAEADILVDQLRLGWYGALAVEAMARAVPVVAYLEEGDLARIPPPMRAEMPIVNASPETLPEALARLLEDAELREDLGRRGHEFVRRWHHPMKIARRMLQLYRDPAQSFWAGYDPETSPAIAH